MGQPTDRAPVHRRLVTALVAAPVLVVLTVAALVVALVALGTLVPGIGLLSGASTLLTPALGPTLVVVGLVAALGAGLLRRRFPRWATAVASVAAAGTVATVVVVAIVVGTTVAAGGSVDLLRALAPSSPGVAPTGDRAVYTRTADGQELHASVYRPAGPQRPAPVLVYVHGGGWIRGSDTGAAGDMRWFADRGWLVVSVEYTLARDGRPTWDVAGPQVGCALGWVAAQAPALGGDPGRIALTGDSAGGQLAVSVGYAAAAGRAASSCGGPVPVPTGVAVQYPAVDMVGAYDHGFAVGALDLDARYFGRTYTGGTPDEVPERYRAVSGEPAVTPAAPPTLVIGPTRDDLVPFDGVRRFTEVATAAGVDTTLVPLPFANHGYDGLAEGSLGNQARRTITLAWLDRYVRTPST